MTLDDIQASADTVMTAELLRLFRYAGCDPTTCHACQKRIKDGDTFKLVPHLKPGAKSTDEMCCSKCGEPELIKRDACKAKAKAKAKAEAEAARREVAPYYVMPGTRTLPMRGYSRPSKEPL